MHRELFLGDMSCFDEYFVEFKSFYIYSLYFVCKVWFDPFMRLPEIHFASNFIKKLQREPFVRIELPGGKTPIKLG